MSPPIVVSGREVILRGVNSDTPAEELIASLVADGDGLGLLRVYLASQLTSGQDSVALGGVLADALRKQPQTIHRLRAATDPLELAPLEEVVILDTNSRVVLNFLDVGATSSVILQVKPYLGADTDSAHLEAISSAGSRTGSAYVDSTANEFCSWLTQHGKNTAGTWGFASVTPGMEFPRGVEIILRNASTTDTRSCTYAGSYSVL